MNFKTHFHTKYNSNGLSTEYIKISVEMENEGLFCVIANNTTGEMQRQCYPFSKRPKNTNNYIGKYRIGYYDSIGCLESAWNSLTDKQRELLHKASTLLPSSCKMYFKNNHTAGGEHDECDAKHYAQWVRVALQELKDNGTVSPSTKDALRVLSGTPSTPSSTPEQVSPVTEQESPAPVSPATKQDEIVEETWNDVNLHDFTPDDLSSIVEQIRRAHGGPIDFNGKTYKIDNINGSIFKLKVMSSVTKNVSTGVDTTTEQESPKPVQRVRKTVKMAQMVDDENLTEFVRGCFYRVVMASSDFVTIKTDNGQERRLKSSRVRLVDVYAEAPINE